MFKYTNIVNVFSLDFAIKLLKHIKINNYLINLVNSEQAFYKFSYNLKLVKLKQLKTCNKTNLAINFITLFKFFINVFIFFIYKFNSSF